MEGDVEGEQEQGRAQIEPDQGYSVSQDGKRQGRGILEEPNVCRAGDDEPSEEIHKQHGDKYPAGPFRCLTNHLRSDQGGDWLWKHGPRDWYPRAARPDRKSTRLNSSHLVISYAVFCLKKKKKK